MERPKSIEDVGNWLTGNGFSEMDADNFKGMFGPSILIRPSLQWRK